MSVCATSRGAGRSIRVFKIIIVYVNYTLCSPAFWRFSPLIPPSLIPRLYSLPHCCSILSSRFFNCIQNDVTPDAWIKNYPGILALKDSFDFRPAIFCRYFQLWSVEQFFNPPISRPGSCHHRSTSGFLDIRKQESSQAFPQSGKLECLF